MLSFSRLVADVHAEGRDPLQRRHARARPRPSAWLGEQAGSPSSRASGTPCSRRSRPGRPLGQARRARRRSPPSSSSSAPTGPRTSPAPRGAPTAAPSRSSSSLARDAGKRAVIRWQRRDGRSTFASRCASSRRSRCRRSPCARTRPAAVLVREEECGVRTPFQRDRDRIVHSKPFRRLKGKTQVFIDPAGDHYRTRMTHTLETTGIARVVARALRLNEDLVEAIGLGPRHRPPAVRPRRRGGARRGARRVRRLPPQRAVAR